MPDNSSTGSTGTIWTTQEGGKTEKLLKVYINFALGDQENFWVMAILWS